MAKVGHERGGSEEIEICKFEIDLHGRALLPPEDRGGWRLVQVELLSFAALCSPPYAARPRCPEEGGSSSSKWWENVTPRMGKCYLKRGEAATRPHLAFPSPPPTANP